MESKFRYISPAEQCAYLPDQKWQLEYQFFPEMTVEDHHSYLNQGWRRAGPTLFRPQCPSCRSCQCLRVLVDSFAPNRSQRRTHKLNELLVGLEIGTPTVTAESTDLYVRHHAFNRVKKEWPFTGELQALEHLYFLTKNPFPVQEWRYRIDNKLVAVCYVDVLPDGFSGIYFIHDPDFRRHSLGTWMIMAMIERARQLSLPYVYLGYYVQGCRSMEYKGNFNPHQILDSDGTWRDH